MRAQHCPGFDEGSVFNLDGSGLITGYLYLLYQIEINYRLVFGVGQQAFLCVKKLEDEKKNEKRQSIY